MTAKHMTVRVLILNLPFCISEWGHIHQEAFARGQQVYREIWPEEFWEASSRATIYFLLLRNAFTSQPFPEITALRHTFKFHIMAFQDNQDWQLTKKTALERNQYMFNNSLMSDIQFTCGESSRKFYANKYVLATSSPVFFTMFYGSIPETKSEICVDDTDDATFEEFLRFLYTESCQLTAAIAVKVMYLSRKYMVPSLTEKCVEEFKKIITAINVATVVEQALLFQEEELVNLCWKVFDSEAAKVVTSKSFNYLSQETMTSLLKRKSLNTIPEVELFQAVIQWCDNQCLKKGLEPRGENRRSVLGDAVHQISFVRVLNVYLCQREFCSVFIVSSTLTAFF